MLSPSTYRRILQGYITDRDDDNQEKLDDQQLINQHWIDNYQDKIATTNPHYRQAIYRSTQMTAWTVRTWDKQFNFLHKFTDNKDTKQIPAIPKMESILDQIVEFCGDSKENHFESAFVEQAEVYNVPEKANLDEEDVDLCHFIVENRNDTGSRWPMGLF